MKKLFVLVFTAIFICSIVSCSHINSEKEAVYLDTQPHIILISIDGFRHDYAEKFGAKNLLKIASKGSRAESLIPCYPSKTFPNHYSIITGLYPDNHGIVDNYFYDPDWQELFSIEHPDSTNGRWFGGKPFWELVNTHDLKSASYFWIGSDKYINGNSPTYFKNYEESVPNSDRIDQVIKWLQMPAETRPQFITLYFSEVDTQGHTYGPDSEQTKNAVLEIDKEIGRLYDSISSLNYPVNLIIVSDHGMTQLDSTKGIKIKDLIRDNNSIKFIPRDALLMLYIEDTAQIDKIKNELRAKADARYETYKRQDIPEQLHYGKNNRIGDILLIPHPEYHFSEEYISGNHGGTHGYDPDSIKDMHGIFYAIGPNIKNHYTIRPFRNIHIYPFMAQLMSLPYDTANIDGKFEVVKELLK